MTLSLQHVHPWQVTTREAIAIQDRLARLVNDGPLTGAPRTVAGVDVSVRGDRVQAAVVVLRLPDLSLLDQAIWRGPVQFPYVPGLLSFREAPAVLAALDKIRVWPDLIMTDSQGRAHPRRFGLACHIGVLLDQPCIGVAKSKLVGNFSEPGPLKGDSSALLHGDEEIGTVLRTRDGIKPLFVSVGHKVSLPQAVDLTLACCTRYKIPEPTRQAHLLSRRLDLS